MDDCKYINEKPVLRTARTLSLDVAGYINQYLMGGFYTPFIQQESRLKKLVKYTIKDGKENVSRPTGQFWFCRQNPLKRLNEARAD